MAGQVRAGFLAGLALAASVISALAQGTPEPSSPQGGRGRNWLAEYGNGEGPKGPAFENSRRALEGLTPEQRKRFQENFQRWANLSPEEKKALREREAVRKKFMEQELDAAIQESGLQFDPERREQFVKRYTEERRLIEEQLHKEMTEKRRPLVRAMIARLKAEFSAQGTPVTAPSQTIQTASPAPPAKP